MKRWLNHGNAEPTSSTYEPTTVAYHYLYEVPASNGAKYLDFMQPGWARTINHQTFNMGYSDSDILAQVYKFDSREVIVTMAWSQGTLVAHGFIPFGTDSYSCDALTLAWRNLIADRLNEVGK